MKLDFSKIHPTRINVGMKIIDVHSGINNCKLSMCNRVGILSFEIKNYLTQTRNRQISCNAVYTNSILYSSKNANLIFFII